LSVAIRFRHFKNRTFLAKRFHFGPANSSQD
jgi:hypothetical protein